MTSGIFRRLIRMRELPEITGLSRTELYRRIKSGTFPQPIRIGAQSVAWRSSDINRWLDSPMTFRAEADLENGNNAMQNDGD